jgi:hypothetical protein
MNGSGGLRLSTIEKAECRKKTKRKFVKTMFHSYSLPEKTDFVTKKENYPQ